MIHLYIRILIYIAIKKIPFGILTLKIQTLVSIGDNVLSFKKPTFNPTTWKTEADRSVFEATLVYRGRVGSRIALATWKNPR